LIAIQKDGMMKLADVSSNVVYLVDCNGQRNGGCQNLVSSFFFFTKYSLVVLKS
jgi:hypothetical protein